MVATVPEIKFPEIIIGIVAPIGAEVNACVREFVKYFKKAEYEVVEIKVTDVFRKLKNYIEPTTNLEEAPLFVRYDIYTSYGNQLRSEFSDDILAATSLGRIVKSRPNLPRQHGQRAFERVVYIVHQFKRKEEIDLFRAVYGRLFFQVSVYSRRGARVDYLAQRFANSDNSANPNMYRYHAENLVQRDENEKDEHGQKVSKVFHDADFIINSDIRSPSIENQIIRFCDLLFGSNSISPTKVEYGMFIAKAAALRTLDLSRQVGAAIFTNNGEIVSMGSNEVPKGQGGTYWGDDGLDDREYVREHDSNDRRKLEILSEITGILNLKIEDVMKIKGIRDSQFMDALEYGRIVHAEILAISDAARLGRSTHDTVLYCTTFPCHMCAKHIVASGVKKVVFLEPYPKSLVADLHSDSISIENSDRGRYEDFQAVDFEHFHGITPRRYRELFERGKRKDDNGKFRQWNKGNLPSPQPNLGVNVPFYQQIEKLIFEDYLGGQLKNKGIDPSVLDPETSGGESASTSSTDAPQDVSGKFLQL